MNKIGLGLCVGALALSLSVPGVLAAGRGGGLQCTGDGICDNCGAGHGTCYEDADGDGICDNYSTGRGACYGDADGDGVCDNYGTGLQSHHGRGLGGCRNR